MIDGIRCSYYAYIIKVHGNRDAIRDKLGSKGIGTSVMYHPAHLQPAYREQFGFTEGDLPVTEAISKKVISLPIYPDMRSETIDFIASALEEEV
jgi:dTDP-4-amino-4,6-dideoxygalactose transaminase